MTIPRELLTRDRWCFNAARRAAIDGLSAEAIDDMAAVLRLEAKKKLSSWRVSAINALLDSQFPVEPSPQGDSGPEPGRSDATSKTTEANRRGDLEQRQSTLMLATFILFPLTRE